MTSLLAVVALMGMVATAPVDVSLVYAEFPWGLPNEPYAPAGYAWHGVVAAPPTPDVKFPNPVCKDPLYDVVSLGAGKWHVMLDKSTSRESFYDRIYLDTDGDKDLTDEKPLEARLDHGGGYQRLHAYGTIKAAEKDGLPKPYTLALTLSYRAPGLLESVFRYLMGQPATPILAVQSQCAYFGMLNHNGVNYRLWLDDANFNGVFTDVQHNADTDPPANHDRLYIERDEPLPGLPRDAMDAVTLQLAPVPLSPRIGIGDALFDVKVDLTALKMTFTPVPESETTAKLQLPPDVASLSLLTSDKTPQAAWYYPAQTIALPQGNYRFNAYRLARHDPQGDLWEVVCSDPCAKASAPDSKRAEWPKITLAAGQTMPLLFGEPVRAAIKIIGASPGFFTNTAHFTFETRGASGEPVLITHEGSRTKLGISPNNYQRPAEPTVKAVKADGEVAWQGAFRYG